MNTKKRLVASLVVCLFASACSGSDGGEKDIGGGKDTGGGADGTVHQADGSVPSGFTKASCEKAMDRFIGAACPDASYWTKLKNSACSALNTSQSTSHCATPLQKANSAVPNLQGATFSCVMGATDTTSVAAVDVLLGVLCVATVNNNDCAGVSCKYNSDCPSNYSCNDAIKRCYRKDASFCVGLPCKYNMDCPTGLTCNNGTGQCNAT